MVAINLTKKTNVPIVLLIAGVYGYFLLFSQFAFLEMVREKISDERIIKSVLASMAVGGIVGGFFLAKTKRSTIMPWAMMGCTISSLLAPYAQGMLAMGCLSLLMGLSLGAVTVIIAAQAGEWQEGKTRCTTMGCGTGLGYALCNVPTLFQASPHKQALFSAVMMSLSLLSYFWISNGVKGKHSSLPQTQTSIKGRGLFAALVVFLAFVWLDSAAFYIIQHAPDLKKSSWGNDMLWRNAVVHALAACGTGILLDRGSFRQVMIAAMALLCLAAWWVNFSPTRISGGFIYPIAVSMYSTALVCWPSLIAKGEGSWQRAAWVFSIAGWIGSGLGVGMAENLQQVPLWFIVLAGSVAAFLLIPCKGSVLAAGLVTLFSLMPQQQSLPQTPEVRGRMVYVAEGCIHCHSKYHRRGSIDDTYWRVSESFPLQEQPVLIGNRRQGPDLTDVGSRRSAAWLREHFLSPRTFYPNSIMPSYGHLFQDQRGDDVIAYLTQNINPQPMRLREVKLGDAQYGKMLFQQQCSACHGTMGLGNGPVAKNLLRPPTNLQTGPFVWSAGEGAFLHKRLAGIIRDGIPGTDMPGHETWTDEQVANVVAYIVKLRSADP